MLSYCDNMIKSFNDKEAQKIFNRIALKKYSNIQNIIERKLDMIHFAQSQKDSIAPPSNHFESLKGYHFIAKMTNLE